MLALSIHQPHAENIMRGKKRMEFRTKQTNVRGRVCVYACRRFDSPEGKALPRGVIVGTVEVYDCTGVQGDYRWHLRKPKRLAKPRRPKGRPQPIWFNPFARG